MTQLQPTSIGNKKRSGKAQLKIDMTPLVDLGFLLITFFIFTTTMAEPYTTDLYMPAGDAATDGGTKTGKSNALTILLSGNDSLYYYHGKWEDAQKTNTIYKTNYHLGSGIGAIIREKQKNLGKNKGELLIMIKPMETSSYNNLMNALDEVQINNVKKYAIMDVTESENSFVLSKAH